MDRHRNGREEWKDEEYGVRIVRTPCNLGGWRLVHLSSGRLWRRLSGVARRLGVARVRLAACPY
jgi:hypothetical protein